MQSPRVYGSDTQRQIPKFGNVFQQSVPCFARWFSDSKYPDRVQDVCLICARWSALKSISAPCVCCLEVCLALQCSSKILSKWHPTSFCFSCNSPRVMMGCMYTNLVLEDLEVIRSDVLLVNYTKLAELRGGPLSIAEHLDARKLQNWPKELPFTNYLWYLVFASKWLVQVVTSCRSGQ